MVSRKLEMLSKERSGLKRFISLIMSLVLVASFVGCSDSDSSSDSIVKESDVGNTSSSDETNTMNTNDTEETEVATSKSSDSNILVVYFSRTGNTEELALYVADYCNADVFEIEAKEPYTEEDIDYGNSNSRTSIEQNDSSVRPEIANQVTNMEQYNLIILAYPIWWGQAPRIIDTFLESYDFTNKTIIPFCTSASSDIGSSDDDLHALVSSNVVWVEGKRFAAGTSEETIIEWINTYLY